MIILGDARAYPSGSFTLSDQCLAAEASDLGYHGPHQIYDDACDVGIAIRSERTGELVRYYLSGEDSLDGEDVAGWHFKPITEDIRRVPGCARTDVLIIND